jgi:hypothetical protein
MGESLKERQENELEALQAIFMDDFCDLNEGNKVFKAGLLIVLKN